MTVVEYLSRNGLLEIANWAELEQGKPAQYRMVREEQIAVAESESKIFGAGILAHR